LRRLLLVVPGRQQLVAAHGLRLHDFRQDGNIASSLSSHCHPQRRIQMSARLCNSRTPWLPAAVVLLWLFGWQAAGASSEWRSPEQVPGTVAVSVEEASALHQQGVPFVDVRSARQYSKRHIAGAAHLDLNNGFTAGALQQVAAKDEPLVIYCNGVMCSRSSRACEQAVGWGFTKVHYFRGGIADWRRADLPVASAD
jgi:rhodanese-related sulfurtransferase